MNALVNEKIQALQRTAQRVIAAQAGDRAAFGELFVQYEKSIYAIALRRTGDPTEAQELVQDVFVQAMQKIDQLRTPEAFGGWLRRIVHRMAINRSRFACRLIAWFAARSLFQPNLKFWKPRCWVKVRLNRT